MWLKIILTPSCGDKRKKQPEFAQNSKGWLRFFDYNIKTVLWIFTISTLFMSSMTYKLLKFSDYSCFQGQGIHCWYFYKVILFELPWKSRSTSGPRVPQRYWLLYLMDFHISSLFMFSRSRNPLLTFLLSYDVWVTSIIQVNFRFERYWWFCLMNFLKFSHYSCFRGQGIHCWYSTELPCLGNQVKLPVQDVLGGTGECVL